MRRAMRRWGILAGLTLLGGPVAAADGDVSLLVGQNALAEDRLDDAGVGSPFEVGVLVNLDFKWPVVLALDLLKSSDDSSETIAAEFPFTLSTDVDTLALHTGVRYFFRKDKPLRPYVGGGLGYTKLDVKQVESGSFGPGTEFDATVVDDGGSEIGWWAGAGILYRWNAFQFGGDVRMSDASAEVTSPGATESLKLDSGGLHTGVFVGWFW